MILILNGASSSGKTALARALQQTWPKPLLHLGIDLALQMLPQKYVGMKESAQEGFQFCEDRDERGPVVRVRIGPVGRRMEASLARAAAAFANDGHDLVLDLVLFDRASIEPYVMALRAQRAYLIGVRCTLSALEARELARGDRFQNLARAQHEQVHEFRKYYDLEVDSTARGPRELAGDVLTFVARQPEPAGLAALDAEFFGGTTDSSPT